ncbi:MAG TPA: FxLYD domain-containing protein [Spirochaetota bacterium]|nr:FxLYD domain-containing protein [Spirochaetota bacterium]
MKKVILVICLLLIFFNFYISSIAQSSDGLQLVSSRSTSDSYFRYVTGTVRNTGSQTYNIVTITFNLYDSSGSIVGNAVDTIQNFRPGAKWKFKAMITEESVVKYEFDSLSGY